MISRTGKAEEATPLRPLNAPKPVEVREADDGSPASLRLGRRWAAVVEVADDTWRIDDEWWRERPITRLYMSVVLEDGTVVGLFKDLDIGAWYRQRM